LKTSFCTGHFIDSRLPFYTHRKIRNDVSIQFLDPLLVSKIRNSRHSEWHFTHWERVQN